LEPVPAALRTSPFRMEIVVVCGLGKCAVGVIVIKSKCVAAEHLHLYFAANLLAEADTVIVGP
jgi:hypothetical protein